MCSRKKVNHLQWAGFNFLSEKFNWNETHTIKQARTWAWTAGTSYNMIYNVSLGELNESFSKHSSDEFSRQCHSRCSNMHYIDYCSTWLIAAELLLFLSSCLPSESQTLNTTQTLFMLCPCCVIPALSPALPVQERAPGLGRARQRARTTRPPCL